MSIAFCEKVLENTAVSDSFFGYVVCVMRFRHVNESNEGIEVVQNKLLRLAVIHYNVVFAMHTGAVFEKNSELFAKLTRNSFAACAVRGIFGEKAAGQ